MTHFDQWALAVDAHCRTHLACGWHDLCGDRAPLLVAFEARETPLAFVRWWAEKYDLCWSDDIRLARPEETR
jgi:hypothetical protein